MRWLVGLLLVILAALQYRLWFGPGSWAEVAALKKDLATQQLINEQLQARNAVLEATVRDLKEGLDGIEYRARRELGLIKEGETFFWIIDDQSHD
jgi:cell division protein FtsB